MLAKAGSLLNNSRINYTDTYTEAQRKKHKLPPGTTYL